MQTLEKPSAPAPVNKTPSRYQTAKATLFMDRFMSHFIKVGGIGVILAVLGIFVFIGLMIIPLFEGAKVKELKSISLPGQNYIAMGVDEWGELPFFVDESGSIRFINSLTGDTEDVFTWNEEKNGKVTAVSYSAKSQEVYYGTDRGTLVLAKVNYSPNFDGEARVIESTVKFESPIEIEKGSRIEGLDYKDAGEVKLLTAISRKAGKSEVHLITLKQKQSLFGSGKILPDQHYKVRNQMQSEPQKVLATAPADAAVVLGERGKIYYFFIRKGEVALRQTLTPFSDFSDPHISSMDFLFGTVSLSLTHKSGENRIYSLFIPDGGDQRLFGHTKTFDPLNNGANFFHASIRNKAFLIGSDSEVSLRYGTTQDIRWQEILPFKTKFALIGGKYEKLYFLDQENKFHIYDLKDSHPESGLKAFFGKIWYEGYAEPTYQWQSTGGTDDFEPKLSLIPLIIGTLKGTFFAMIFALPIAFLSALYVSQFSSPKVRNIVKPTMEIMAALPSVVLGFLAALWLAPLLEDKVPAIILMLIVIPAVSLVVGDLWSRLPTYKRAMLKSGYEWVALLPLFLFLVWGCWQLSYTMERIFFVVTDPTTGVSVADFRLWWRETLGASFEQRNSMVVGFMMGFAVIPIIFTIAEDSLSNVPSALQAGSLALGASRWQTAFRVILPTAFPGIFSATMVGFGRAVGETMIVVMATGNTPVMDLNIFNGFRTLSANIAVELPEAPYLGTLYRALFLGSMVLFIMTFVVNTIAEVIRQQLREKYKTV